MQPVKTKYSGTTFKSLMEARWAVFFDALGLTWKYEHRQFHLGYYPMRYQQKDAAIRAESYGIKSGYSGSDNLIYTPDFLLPDNELFVEVKPSELTQTERIKISRLSFRAKADFLVLIGFDHFFRVPWFDALHHERLNDLGFLSPDNPEEIKAAFQKAMEYSGSKDFSDFEKERF